MNAFRMSKQRLVTTSFFSNRHKKSVSFVWSLFKKLLFFIKTHDYRATFQAIQLWCVDLRPSLISFWIKMRAKMAPSVWLIRDTVSILLTHVRAIVLTFWWHSRYAFLQFINRKQTRQSSSFVPSNKLLTQLSWSSHLVLDTTKQQLVRFREDCAAFSVAFKQFTKQQLLALMAVVVFCSLVEIKSKDNATAVRASTTDISPLSLDDLTPSVIVREFQKKGKIQKTLYGSLLDNGFSHTMIDMVHEALKDKLDTATCTHGDEYTLIWQVEQREGQHIATEQLTSVRFKGQNKKQTIYSFYYTNGFVSGWFGKEGLPKQVGLLDSPIINGKITSRFSRSRKHPILRYYRPHYGTDYAAPKGTPIQSIADGVIEEAKYKMGNGRYVRIKHALPYQTEYLHMSRFAEGIEAGATVKKKQTIGYIGMSGLTTGPHVCFRLLKEGKPIDPLTERCFTDLDNAIYKKWISQKMAQLDKQ
ncbi:MAG: M23 family metallopeptidase [Saprospiraceae bacterium]|nr:M23 family metallopeptidase [Saprospiraceae bacterium]